MKAKSVITAISVVLFGFLSHGELSAANAFRIWTNSDGKTIEARLIERTEAGVVVLEMRNAKRYDLEESTLSEADITWMNEQESAAAQAERDTHGIAFDSIMATPGEIIYEHSLAEIPEEWRGGNGEWSIVEGALSGKELEEDDHAATFKQKLAFQNAIIQYSFKLDGAKSTTFSVNDSEDHVCRVSFSPSGFSTQKDDHDHEGPDTGVKFTTHEMELEAGTWHTVIIEILGDTLVAQIDDKDNVSFGSHELIAEVEKASIGFTIAGESVQFKDLTIWEALPNEEWEKTHKRLARKLDVEL